MSGNKSLRIGVIGCGGIAQMMHLPYLASMPDLFEITAIADLSRGVLGAIGARYNIAPARRFTRYAELLELALDAVLVLTSGDHYAAVTDALAAGKHVLSEKPLCYTLRQADAIIDAARHARRHVMVGYMKRYDPGYRYAYQRVREMQDIRYVQINTLHPAEDDYLYIHNLVRFNDAPREELARLRSREEEQLMQAVGAVSPTLQRLYADVFLGSMVHDVNALRGLLGEPDAILFADWWQDERGAPSITTTLRYGDATRAVYTWTYLPELRDYFQELACMSPAQRVRIQFPSPYLRHAPTPVVVQGMENGAAFEKRVIVSYAEAFQQELVAFHAAIVNDAPPLTDARDARADIALLQKIFAALKPAGLGGEAAQFL